MLRTIMSTVLAVLIIGFAASTYAADTEIQLVDKACWIEIFEDDNYDRTIRIFRFKDLRNSPH